LFSVLILCYFINLIIGLIIYEDFKEAIDWVSKSREDIILLIKCQVLLDAVVKREFSTNFEMIRFLISTTIRFIISLIKERLEIMLLKLQKVGTALLLVTGLKKVFDVLWVVLKRVIFEVILKVLIRFFFKIIEKDLQKFEEKMKKLVEELKQIGELKASVKGAKERREQEKKEEKEANEKEANEKKANEEKILKQRRERLDCYEADLEKKSSRKI